MKLSIVTAMYKSASFVRAFHAGVTRVVKDIDEPNVELEILFVDDRSPDNSAKVVEELIKEDPRVRLIQLSRNFGQSVAMLAGMRKATGDFIYTSDIDLEDPPELLPQFFRMLIEEPALQSVYGFMSKRKGTLLERVLGRLFYWFLSFFSRERIPEQVWARLMTRKYLDALLEYTEYHIFWSGLFHAVGFRQAAVPVDRKKTGKTSYNYAKKIDLALSAVTSFSTGPLRLIVYSGLVVSFLSFVGALYLLSLHFRGNLVPGWASIVLSVLFTGGMTNLSIGIIGIYVGRIFIQAKQRPRYFIDREL